MSKLFPFNDIVIFEIATSIFSVVANSFDGKNGKLLNEVKL